MGWQPQAFIRERTKGGDGALFGSCGGEVHQNYKEMFLLDGYKGVLVSIGQMSAIMKATDLFEMCNQSCKLDD